MKLMILRKKFGKKTYTFIQMIDDEGRRSLRSINLQTFDSFF